MWLICKMGPELWRHTPTVEYYRKLRLMWHNYDRRSAAGNNGKNGRGHNSTDRLNYTPAPHFQNRASRCQHLLPALVALVGGVKQPSSIIPLLLPLPHLCALRTLMSHWWSLQSDACPCHDGSNLMWQSEEGHSSCYPSPQQHPSWETRMSCQRKHLEISMSARTSWKLLSLNYFKTLTC